MVKRRGPLVPSEKLGILLISGGHEHAHYALMLAAGAAAVGREVVIFATNQGCRAMLADWRSMDPDRRDDAIVGRGVAGFAALRDAATELGVRRIVCEAGLRMAGLDDAMLDKGVEIAGIVTFLEATRGGQLLTL